MRVFIGYDTREPAAFHVLAHSIMRRISVPVQICPIDQYVLRSLGDYWRPVDDAASTEFSLTRFLVPYLSGPSGWSVFMDCDMLCKVDLGEVMKEIDASKLVSVVKHDYVPKTAMKFLGQPQAVYPRKNWSSFMVFNNEACWDVLTREYVNGSTPADLHRFRWASDDKIGSIPLAWNWLVGEYEHNDEAKVLHYTLGGPWFKGTADCDHAAEWIAERDHMLRCG